MNREQLAEVLRAAGRLADDRPLVMGSQAILGTYDEDVLPPAATISMEADVAFLDDQDRAKADLVTGAIGEDSTFHQMRGYYAEGIHLDTATLPEGWRDRLILQPVPAGPDGPATHACFLEPHDLVVAKLAAFREKDVRFVTELARAGLVDIHIARERLDDTALHPLAKQRAEGLLDTLSTAKPVDQNSDVVDPEVTSPADDAARLRRWHRQALDSRTQQEPPPAGPTRR